MAPTLPEKLVVLVEVVAEEEFLLSWFQDLRDEPPEQRRRKLDDMSAHMAGEDEDLANVLLTLKEEAVFQAANEALEEILKRKSEAPISPDDGKPREKFGVHQLDHVEIFVTNREAIAAWYDDVLGLEVIFESESPDGPWMISSDNGNTMIALFERNPEIPSSPTTNRTMAFRVDGRGFLEFLDRLDTHPVMDEQGRQITAEDVVEHQALESFSIYFNDPSGNPLEITSYDYALIAKALKDG